MNQRLPATRSRTRTSAVLGFLLPLLTSGLLAQTEETPTVIQDVDVIDVNTGAVLRSRDVVIAHNRIRSIEATGSSEFPDAKMVPGSGKFLIPGLFDSHVHLSADPVGFPLLLVAHGVTFVRDTGSETSQILRIKENVESGATFGPDMVVTGAIIDGDPPVWPFSEAVDTPDEARAAVQKLKHAGVDQIKLYSMLRPEVYAAAIEEAHSLGLPAVGHVPTALSIEDALELGHDCVEHFMGFEELLARLAGGTAVVESRNPWADIIHWQKMPEIDETALEEFLDQLAAACIVQCPTVIVIKSIGRLSADDYADDPRMAYVAPGIRSFWESGRYQSFAPTAAETWQHMQGLVMKVYEAGVPLLIGTDLANPLVFAGSAVHEEMEIFRDAGVPEIDVLRAATVVPAEFFGVLDRFGSVEEGKVASLVLLHENPLEDISAVREIDAVFLRGKTFDRAALDALMEKARRTKPEADPESSFEPDAAMAELPGEVIAQGRYDMKFGEYDAGYETYRMTRDPGGFHLYCESRPQGGLQQPFVLKARFDQHFEFLSAEWKQRSEPPLAARYVKRSGEIVAHAMQGEQSQAPQTVEFAEDAAVGLPVTASDFFVYQDLDLDAGESTEIVSFGFGFAGWQLVKTKIVVQRHDNTVIPFAGKDVPAMHYTSNFETPMGEFRVQTWIGEDGITLKSILNMPFGDLVAVHAGVPTTE